MKNKFAYLSVFVLFLTVFVGACKTLPKSTTQEKSSFDIKSVTWMIERLHPSIWDKKIEDSAEMFVSFSVSYSGRFDTDLVESLLVESPLDIWTLDRSQLKKIIEIREEKNIAIFKRLQCGEIPGAVPLGEWNFVLNLKDGNKYEQKLNITGFEKTASKISDEEEPVKATKKENNKKPIKMVVPNLSNSNEIQAINTPVINSVSKDENSIEIYFTVNDSKVRNGYFWFDVPDEKYYKDSGSMVDGSGNPVNGCRQFFINGKKSRYILRKNAENKEWFDKITACFFAASDTNRVSDPWEERNRTVSAKAMVK